MPDNEELLRNLDALDLERMTVADIRAVNNPVLRRVLLSALTDLTSKLEHTSHGSHTSHAKDVILDIPFENPVVQPGDG